MIELIDSDRFYNQFALFGSVTFKVTKEEFLLIEKFFRQNKFKWQTDNNIGIFLRETALRRFDNFTNASVYLRIFVNDKVIDWTAGDKEAVNNNFNMRDHFKYCENIRGHNLKKYGI